jgi:site-specific recombinase XerC
MWAAQLRDAGVRPVTLHAARHSSVSAMLAAGVPLRAVAAWHGHDPVMAARVYDHPDGDALASAGAVLGAVLDGSVTNR